MILFLAGFLCGVTVTTLGVLYLAGEIFNPFRGF